MPSNFDDSADKDNPYVHYDAKHLYAFLADYTLQRDIDSQYEYSNLGMGLLGHLLSRAANKSYEQLIQERICKPLGMTDTVLTLRRARQARLAPGHTGPKKAPRWDFTALAGCGAIRSTGQDMIAFVSANLGFRKTTLAPALAAAVKPRVEAGSPDMDIA